VIVRAGDDTGNPAGLGCDVEDLCDALSMLASSDKRAELPSKALIVGDGLSVFDLLISAQAFHWVDPAVRYLKAAAALRPRGALALIRNETAGLEPGLRAELDAAYARWFPAATWTAARDSIEPKRAEVTGEVDRSGRFGPVRAASFPWSASYTTREYLDLLETHSDHALLEPRFRVPLYGAVADAIERRGGHVEVPYVAVLLLTVRND